MAGTIPTTTAALLRAQIAALEEMYKHARPGKDARRILDIIHVKRDELVLVEVVQSWAA